MTTIDRYLILLFTKVLLVLFISLAGLYIVADFFGNMDEFYEYGRKHESGAVVGLATAVADYYAPRCLQLFDHTAGLLAMIATVFSLTMLQRSNELTALMAAGVPRSRVVWPLLWAALGVSLLGIANREFGLPLVRAKLVSNAQDLLGEKSRKCTPRYDIRTEILISAKSTVAKGRELVEPQFRLPPELGAWGRILSADSAFARAKTKDHPTGYLLKGVKVPAELSGFRSASLDGQPVLYSPADTPWLAPDECFVASVVTFEQLAVGGSWRRYLSTYELVTGLHGRSIEPGADVRVILHARLVQPLLDISLVLLGLPLIFTRASRNIFWASFPCLGIVAVLYMVAFTCHGLGSNYLLDPTIAAWTPLVIFGPLAYVLSRPIWD